MAEHGRKPTPDLLPVRGATWHPERSRQTLARVHAQVAQRARLERRAVAVLAVAACALALVAAWPAERRPQSEPVAIRRSSTEGHPGSSRSVQFVDGSSVELMDAQAKVKVEHVAPDRVEVALLDGKGHFSVASQPDRQFVVHVAKLSVVVLGASFTVTREEDRAHVWVQSGTVEVAQNGEQRSLSSDEAAWFDLDAAHLTLSGAVDAGAPRPVPVDPAHQRFLEHARKRQYARAMEVIRQKPSVVRDTGEELMLAADAARLSGDAKAAVPYLRRVSERHAKDSRAPLAAFTLGRILLFELGQPAEARRAFALTRKLSADGSLAEDALAREVEAAARAGSTNDARLLAQEYLTRYPRGLRRAQVMPFAESR